MKKIIKFSDLLEKHDAQMNELEKKYPWLKLYVEAKRRHPKTIFFYRLEGFYETFSDDATAVSRVLGVGIATSSEGLLMCGVPVPGVSRVLRKMVNAGYRVATCETVADKSSSSGHRHIVTRAVNRSFAKPLRISLKNEL